MAAASGLDAAALGLGLLGRTRGLSYRVGERLEIVLRRLPGVGVGREPQHIPAARCGESLGVVLAQVVAVRLGIDRQGPEHGRLIGVHVRQGGDGLSRTGSTGTTSDRTHGTDATCRYKDFVVRLTGMGSNQPGTPPRGGPRRDRRGRGMRGPLSLPGPFTPDGVPGIPPAAADFDSIVLGVIDRIRARVGDRIDAVEFAVEDHPLLPDDWRRPVPYASSMPDRADERARIVVFRR